MNVASLALATAVAAVIGCAQPASAQSQDQTGATRRTGPVPGMNGADMNRDSTTNGDDRDAATNGSANDGRSGNDRGDRDSAAADRGDRNQARRRSDNGPMDMGTGPMGRQRMQMMMHAMGGAQFHFARGKSRVDVRCSVQEDTQTCVRAATELLDAIAQMRNGGHGERSGSATGDDNGETNGSAVNPNDRQDEDAPAAPGERM